jgi:hypothetical protein
MPIPDGTHVIARFGELSAKLDFKVVLVCGQNATHYDVMTEDGEHFAVPWRKLEADNPGAVQGTS